MSGFRKRYDMTSGLKPVFKVETCKSLKSGYIGDKILEDTFPLFVKVANPDVSLGSSLGLGAIKSKVSEFLGSQTTDTPLLGVMIDHAFMNRYRTIANLIFQNVLKNKPTGNEYLSEDFIECGFPIRVTLGALTPEGNFIQHPYEGALTAGKIYPTFTGMVAAQTQEIVGSGDRFQITCYGFEYLLSKAPLFEFHAAKGEHLREVFARLLMQFATMDDHFGFQSEESRPADRFGRPRDHLKWPIPILKAMGLIGKRNKLFAKSTIKKNIRLVNCDLTPRLLQDVDFPLFVDKKNPDRGREDMTYLGAINKLSPQPPALMDNQMDMATGDFADKYYSRHQFYFDYQGRPTIMGKLMSTAEIAYGTKKPTHDRNRVRVHDAVIGGNIIHLQMTSTLFMSSGRVILYHLDPDLTASEPSVTHATSEHQNLQAPTRGDGHDFYGAGSYWGNENLFIFDQGEEVDVGGIEPDDLLKDITDRYKYFGMRGSSYMVANPKMQPGDVVRIVDIRDKEGFGTSIAATIDLGKDIATKITSAVAKRFPSLDVSRRLKGQTVNLGLKGVEDVYWIWKARHYVGQNEITSKVFFVKEPQSLIGTTDAYRQHQIQRRKAQQAQGP